MNNIDIILDKLSKSTFRNKFHLKDKDIEYINNKLNALSKSKFRSSFHLRKYMIDYINNKGMNTIESHTEDFIEKNLSKLLPNDGKQTPMRGHPTFIAQHATATCCRGCLSKWHRIPNNIELNEKHKEYIVNVIMKWINKERDKEN